MTSAKKNPHRTTQKHVEHQDAKDIKNIVLRFAISFVESNIVKLSSTINKAR